MTQMERPKLTKELIAATAAAFCESNEWGAGQASDLVRVCPSMHMDGYELAKELDSVCGWMPTAQDVETLDNFGFALREALRLECLSWARDNNVLPPLPVGSLTTMGEITGIYEYDGACYEIRKYGDTDPNRRHIVRFEDVREVTPLAV